MRRRGFSLLLAGTLAGCASSPPRYYRLAAVPGAVRGGDGKRIGVRNVGVPGDLDQNNLVRPGDAYQLNAYANDLWAAPLSSMLQTVMVQNLTQRLPGDTVLQDGGAIGAAPDVYVEIQVLRFTPDASGIVTLQAQIGTRPASAQDFRLQGFAATAPGGNTPEGLAQAMSTLWGQFADTAAGLV
ncbi:PqiC family protein [Acidocella aromatica]|uniref:Putative lipoprotein YmbA n=1 Tax=Acidocella aromatica TaxID=1303579 RepID=A0A840VW99_9PROT|nr:PqiC family protein [Acidocella aromatica]MBB5374402.1 putative lipoprotein YmbA [Acidocella aromatica]